MDRLVAHNRALQRAKDEGYAVLATDGDTFIVCDIMPEEVAHGEEWQTVAEYYDE